MVKKLLGVFKKLFWKIPLSPSIKEKLRQYYSSTKDRFEEKSSESDIILLNKNINYDTYVEHVLNIPTCKSPAYKEFVDYTCDKAAGSEFIFIAYYLTQYHPNNQNDEWWGKGTTEWTNVSKSMPQFDGHYQPRLPGELGYYDLRIKDNMCRQIELALNYGIDVFCFYYYWFDGERLLEQPLNMFLEDKTLNMPFCICWANENWTKRFSGTNEGILMKMGETEESYQNFIFDILPLLKDERYFAINNKPVIIVYRPSLIPNPTNVIDFWREVIRQNINKEAYIIAVQERDTSMDWCDFGFDAETEFQPKQIQKVSKDITTNVKPIRKDFTGKVFDYEDLVQNSKYKIKANLKKKVYRAVMPMWDNTARRNHRGTIFHNSTPTLYKKWLKNVMKDTSYNKQLDSPLIFINAWNEWGEGAYLEPDRYWGYAYLQATKESKGEYVQQDENNR